jgi:hypothetical protein
MKELDDLDKMTKWMNKCTMLLPNNKVVHNCKYDSLGFTSPKGYIIHSLGSNLDEYIMNSNYGLFIHTDCYNYVHQKLKVKINYSMIPVKPGHSYKIMESLDYGKIENYLQQDFNFLQLVLDKNQELCISPLINNKTIKTVLSQLKIKKDNSRKGPHVSATFYSNGDIKFGNNGKLWIVNKNKWTEIKDNIIELKLMLTKYNNFIRSFSFIGQYNKHGIFVKDIDKKKIVLLTLEKNIDIINKNIKN